MQQAAMAELLLRVPGLHRCMCVCVCLYFSYGCGSNHTTPPRAGTKRPPWDVRVVQQDTHLAAARIGGLPRPLALSGRMAPSRIPAPAAKAGGGNQERQPMFAKPVKAVKPEKAAAKKAAAVTIQAYARGHRARALALSRERHIIHMQAVARGRQNRNARMAAASQGKAHRAAIRLQALARGRSSRSSTELLLNARRAKAHRCHQQDGRTDGQVEQRPF